MKKYAEVIRIKNIYDNEKGKKIAEGIGEITEQTYLFNLDDLQEQVKEKGYKKVKVQFVTDGVDVVVLDERHNVLAYTNVLLEKGD